MLEFQGVSISSRRTRSVKRVAILIASAVLAWISFTLSSSAQVRRYQVIDTGSFGGPNAHVSIGAHILNNNGSFTGFADTAEPDPYAPDGCWDGDCLVAHVSKWRNGQLIDLGVLDGGPNSESNWISENGWIAGDSQNGLLDSFGGWEIRAVVWDMSGKLSEVGTLDGGDDSLARAVNSTGEIVGLSTTTIPDDHAMIGSFGLPFPFQTRAYSWRNGIIHDLGTLGGSDAMALGINESGQIVGNSYLSSKVSPVCGIATGAFLWEHGTMTNVGSLGGTCTQVPFTGPAINDRGQIVGYSFLQGDQVFHPFLWDKGDLKDLGTGGGSFGFASSLNAGGDAVGWETLPGNDAMVHATLWSGGQITDLGALGPDQCSVPSAINARRQVVGLSGNCDFDDPTLRAFIWEPGGQMVDLNTLISPSLRIQLRNVATINDRGEMAAVAFFPNGDHRPVLLIPCDVAGNDEECRDAEQDVSLELSARAPTIVPSASSNHSKLNPRDLVRRLLPGSR